jgi:hypothetical protein
LKATATLKLELSDREARVSLLSVLVPDNRDLPNGLELKVRTMGSKGVELDISSPSASTSLSTVLAILRDVSLFDEVWLLSRGDGARVHRA